MKDKLHGEFRFEWRGDLLILYLCGSFNENAIAAFFEEIMVSFSERKATPWVLLSALDRDMIGSPTVLEIIKNAYRWGQTNKCRAAAISGANVIIDHIYQDFFKTLTYPARLFEEQDDAIAWLNQQL